MIPDKHYMDNQAELEWPMRSILLEWVAQVHAEFSLLPETLFLSVNLIDRFLSCKSVSVESLQLAGITALFIAAKYEETRPLSVLDVHDIYTVDQILTAERIMLNMLEFELGWPGPLNFLRRINRVDDYDLKTRTLAKYFLEVTIMDERLVGTKPSMIAAGAYLLAREMVSKSGWVCATPGHVIEAPLITEQTTLHVYYSGYTQSQLKPLVTMIIESCENFAKHHPVIFQKYAAGGYEQVSIYAKNVIDKGFTLSTTLLICQEIKPEKRHLESLVSDKNYQRYKSIAEVLRAHYFHISRTTYELVLSWSQLRHRGFMQISRTVLGSPSMRHHTVENST